MTLPRWEETLEDDFATDAARALAMAGPAPRTVQMDYDEEVAFQAERKLHDPARGDDPRSFFLVVSFTHPHEPYGGATSPGTTGRPVARATDTCVPASPTTTGTTRAWRKRGCDEGPAAPARLRTMIISFAA